MLDSLKELAGSRDPCLQDRELYLIRNLTRGRGVSFFDDFGYYPDFIKPWFTDSIRQLESAVDLLVFRRVAKRPDWFCFADGGA